MKENGVYFVEDVTARQVGHTEKYLTQFKLAHLDLKYGKLIDIIKDTNWVDSRLLVLQKGKS